MPMAIGAKILAAMLLLMVPNADASGQSACTTGAVATEAGPVCGSLTTTTSGRQAKAFLGIPYAESTGGANRWKPPVPRRPWSDTLAAVQFGALCTQTAKKPDASTPGTKHTHKLPVPRVHPAEGAYVQPPPESEDCLNLNVWTYAGTE